MIRCNKFSLDNGLRVVLHQDKSSPLVAVNLLYDVGSKDEDPHHTGFAHLFEHLMFSGSKNIPDFDTPIQMAGGENNAYTNADITNYYNIIPADNLETVLWLESDRMKELAFNEKGLDIQKKVVLEEFNETCLNQPYGDVWHHISSLSFQQHPYNWPTIGKVPEHIEQIDMLAVRTFYNKYYTPSNAILVLVGNIEFDHAKGLVQKWFGDIAPGVKLERILQQEPKQMSQRYKEVKSDVSTTALYMSYHMCERNHPDFYASDLLSDVLSNGRSSRFFQNLYKKEKIFSYVDAYITAYLDPGLFVIDSKLLQDTDVNIAIEKIKDQLEDIKKNGIRKEELEKVKNKNISSLHYSEVSILNKAINLAYYELLGDAELINQQETFYIQVTAEEIQELANNLFQEDNCSILVYGPK
jgi:predicted Zn-dependent peptidase